MGVDPKAGEKSNLKSGYNLIKLLVVSLVKLAVPGEKHLHCGSISGCILFLTFPLT